MICDRSAIIPRIGLLSATMAVDTATPRLHIELPVNVKPRSVVDWPKASLNSTTKYTGRMAVPMLVANAEFAQSYMHQPWTARRRDRSSPVVVSASAALIPSCCYQAVLIFPVIPSAARNLRRLLTIWGCLAGNVFRFLTSLRYVRNDRVGKLKGYGSARGSTQPKLAMRR